MGWNWWKTSGNLNKPPREYSNILCFKNGSNMVKAFLNEIFCQGVTREIMSFHQVLLYNSEWLQHLCSLHHRIPLLLKDKALKPMLESNSWKENILKCSPTTDDLATKTFVSCRKMKNNITVWKTENQEKTAVNLVFFSNEKTLYLKLQVQASEKAMRGR